MKLDFIVKQQTLEILGSNEFGPGSKDYAFAHFSFTRDWDGLSKTIFFERRDETEIVMALDQNNCCLVPSELLAEDGSFTVRVEGCGTNGLIIPTNPARVFVTGKGVLLKNTTDSVFQIASRTELPNRGDDKAVYFVKDENATYRWDEDTSKYFCVGRDYKEVKVISGGDA